MLPRLLIAVFTLATLGCAPRSEPAATVRPLVLMASGDTAGLFVPCGCATNQSGGLLRRGTLLAEVRKSADVLYVDVGGAASGHSTYDRQKFTAIIQEELAMGLVAHNLGGPELELGVDLLRKLTQQYQVPWVSCNVQDANGQLITEPVRIITRGDRRFAITGVVAENWVTGQTNGYAWTIIPPREAILSAIAQYQGKYDSLIVLAYLAEPELEQLAADLPEADLVIGGPTGQSLTPRRIGPTLLVSATNKGKFIAKLTSPTKLQAGWSGEVIELTEDFADHPAQEAGLKKFYALLTELDLPASETSFAPLASDALAQPFAGTNRCGECHTEAFKQWQASSHAHAWQVLKQSKSEVDSDCQHCHVTGFGLPNGFSSLKQTPEMVNVGCESCHGPSLAHARDPKVRTPFAGQAASQCLHCHDSENSPQFEFEAYWKKMEHGRES